MHVLIRPRAGEFVYSDVELAVMRHDIETAKDLGAAGVVLGVLNADGTIDADQTAELVALARPLAVTFHKAFDQVGNPLDALDRLVELGVDRVLTSGGRATALQGGREPGGSSLPVRTAGWWSWLEDGWTGMTWRRW